MADIEPRVGMVVASRMGRDKDKVFMVAAIVNPEFVMLADGKYRKLASAKLKRWKHVKPVGKALEGIAAKLETGKKVFDSELYSALKSAVDGLQKADN